MCRDKDLFAVRALCEACVLMECIYKLSPVLKSNDDIINDLKDAIWSRLHSVSIPLANMWEEAAWPPEEIDIDAEMAKNECPSECIETGKLRQDLGEEFILWADEYFSSSEHLNCRITRKDMYDNLLKYVGTGREKFYTPTIFKKKVIEYCKFRDLWFNPHKYNYLTDTAAKLDKDGRPELDDKSGGEEWFIIGEQCYYDIAPAAPENDPDARICKK